MFRNSVFPRLMDFWDKSAAVQISVMFGTLEHFDFESVF